MFHRRLVINNWEFYFINETISCAKYNSLINDLQIMLKGSLFKTIEDYLMNNPRKALADIKNIFNKHFPKKFKKQGMNFSSLLAFHKPINSNKLTMLTGDINFSSNVINECNYYMHQKNLTKIDYALIPHHGAYNEWSSLNNAHFQINNYYLSFGIPNKYGHPSQSLLYSFCYKYNIMPNVATDYAFWHPKPLCYPWCEYIIP